jgi:hypothetical protein
MLLKNNHNVKVHDEKKNKTNFCFTLRRADIKIKLVTKITAAATNENNENKTNIFLTKTQKQ